MTNFKKMKKLFILITVLLAGKGAFAQIESHVTWAYAAKKTSETEAVVFLKATIDEGWHIYSLNVKDGGPVKTSLKFVSSKSYALVGKPTEPAPIVKYDKSFGMNLTFFENAVVFQQKVKLKGKNANVKGSLEYMTCDDKKCLPPETIDFTVKVDL